MPLRERITVGPWRLIPFASFRPEDALDEATATEAAEVIDLYREGGSGRLGAIAHHSNAKVGARVRQATMPNLRRALLLALLDANPTEESPNAAFATATSDNAAFWGHEIDGSGWVTVGYGLVVDKLETVLLAGKDVAIRAPVELPRPTFAQQLDPIYAAAALEVLSQDTAQARRLAEAVDWLDVAWGNSPSISRPTRIFALYSAFELVLGVNRREPMAREISRRLDPPGARQRLRQWQSLKGNPQNGRLTDLGWWFMRFGDPRNALAHGDEVRRSAFRFGRDWHFWIAERRLRQVITKLLVAHTGSAELEVDLPARVRARDYRNAFGAPGP
jgi:hypothetical protein